MICAALKAPDKTELEKPTRHCFGLLAVAYFATSIDAMTVRVGLAFLDVNIWPVAAAIGFATFLMVAIRVAVARLLGNFVGRWAQAIGGVLLIEIGSVIL